MRNSEGNGPDGPLRLTQLPPLPVRLSRDRSTLQVLDPATGTWASVCFNNFTEALAQTACGQMGFDRYPAQASGDCYITLRTSLLHSIPLLPFFPIFFFPISFFLVPFFPKNIGVGVSQNCFNPSTFTYKQNEIQSRKRLFSQELTGKGKSAPLVKYVVPVKECVPHPSHTHTHTHTHTRAHMSSTPLQSSPSFPPHASLPQKTKVLLVKIWFKQT